MVALFRDFVRTGQAATKPGESSRVSQRARPHAEKIETRTSRRLRHCLHMTIWNSVDRANDLGVDSDRRLLQSGRPSRPGARTSPMMKLLLISAALLSTPLCALAQGTSQQNNVRSESGGATRAPVTAAPTPSTAQTSSGSSQIRPNSEYGLAPQHQKQLGITGR